MTSTAKQKKIQEFGIMPINPENINVDNILHGLKDFGRFQVLQYVVISCMQIPNAFNLLAIVFIGYPPKYTCKNMTDLQFSKYTGSDESIAPVYDTCNIRLYNNSLNSSTLLQTMPCINGYAYDAPLDTSIITEWDLVCSKSGMGEITQSLFIAGQGIGALVFPSFADHYGRKPIHILSNFIMVISAGISAMAPSYWIFAPTRLLCGICQQACLISGTSLACEIFPANKRTLMSGLIAVNWGIGVTLLGVFGFLLKNYSWRVLAAVCASTASICIFEMWYIKESFRWLFAQGKLEEGKKIIAFAAKKNNVDFDAIWRKNVEYLEELSDAEKMDNIENQNVMEMKILNEKKSKMANPGSEECQKMGKNSSVPVVMVLRDSGTRKISFINIFNWLMISFTYFGIYMTSNYLAGDRFLNFFLTASMEVIAGVILLKTLTKFSRRNSIAGFQILAGVSLISLAVLKGIGEKTQTMKILTITFTLFGMLGASGAFSGVWLYTPEIYPTNLRSAGTGLASASSRVSSMLAPLTRLMAGQVPWAPGTIFGTGCLMACALLFLLPETRDQQLPQTMEDLKILQSVKNSKVNDIEKTASTT